MAERIRSFWHRIVGHPWKRVGMDEDGWLVFICSCGREARQRPFPRGPGDFRDCHSADALAAGEGE